MKRGGHNTTSENVLYAPSAPVFISLFIFIQFCLFFRFCFHVAQLCRCATHVPDGCCGIYFQQSSSRFRSVKNRYNLLTYIRSPLFFFLSACCASRRHRLGPAFFRFLTLFIIFFSQTKLSPSEGLHNPFFSSALMPHSQRDGCIF